MNRRLYLVAAAAVLSAGMFIGLGWILPGANQAFRVLANHGHHVQRGMNELTLSQLAASGYWFQFHARCALSAAMLALALFASTASRRMRGSGPSIAVGMVAVSVYVSLLLTLQGPRARPLDAWSSAQDLARDVAVDPAGRAGGGGAAAPGLPVAAIGPLPDPREHHPQPCARPFAPVDGPPRFEFGHEPRTGLRSGEDRDRLSQ